MHIIKHLMLIHYETEDLLGILNLTGSSTY